MAISKNKNSKDKKNVEVGELVEFTRKGRLLVGKVCMIREMSVLVELLDPSARLELNLENDKTIVSHSNYRKINSEQ